MKTIQELASLLNATPAEVLQNAQACSLPVYQANDALSDHQVSILAQYLAQHAPQPTVPATPPGDPEKEARALAFLRDVLQTTDLIFLDTCTLMADAAVLDLFLSRLIQNLPGSVRIIIPTRVMEELDRHRHNPSNPERMQRAQHGYDKLVDLQQKKLILLFGSHSDNFADNVFQSVIIQKRIKYRITFITQDVSLAHTIDSFNQDTAVNAKPVRVLKLNRFGYLSTYIWKDASSVSTAPRRRPAFQFKTQLTQIPDTPLGITEIPGLGSIVRTPNGPVVLQEQIASGGEGILYKTSSGEAAKIYFAEKLTARREAKLRRMLSRPLRCDGICYPTAPLLNDAGQFVGFLMPLGKGTELQRSVFVKPLFLKTFPDWRKRDTVELCITLLRKIEFLHQNGILIGDVNPRNILVSSPREVCFVDVDSMQVEEFPCPVGTVTFTAPEIQHREFNTFLRTLGNENFAIATLLFMVMLPGKPPYSQQGGASLADNIEGADFSYPLGSSSNRKTPPGPWRYAWSHLTFELKEMFYQSFRMDGSHHAEANRYTVQEWIGCFQRYLHLLDSGRFAQQDPMSEELFPTRFKHSAASREQGSAPRSASAAPAAPPAPPKQTAAPVPPPRPQTRPAPAPQPTRRTAPPPPKPRGFPFFPWLHNNR